MINYKPIGIIHSPYQDIDDMPIQPSGALGVVGNLTIEPEFINGLRDLDGFSHIIVIYHFHQVKELQLIVTPFLDTEQHGVFATRAPKRPNPIGLSILRLVAIEENKLILENVDILDGTPVLDIEPYVPAFDRPDNVRIGWYKQSKDEVKEKRSDERFR